MDYPFIPGEPAPRFWGNRLADQAERILYVRKEEPLQASLVDPPSTGRGVCDGHCFRVSVQIGMFIYPGETHCFQNDLQKMPKSHFELYPGEPTVSTPSLDPRGDEA